MRGRDSVRSRRGRTEDRGGVDILMSIMGGGSRGEWGGWRGGELKARSREREKGEKRKRCQIIGIIAQLIRRLRSGERFPRGGGRLAIDTNQCRHDFYPKCQTYSTYQILQKQNVYVIRR